MAKKAARSKSDRSDPKKNKSLAIRLLLEKQPTAKTAEIIAAVKKEYGHSVAPNRVYMVKTQSNMATDGRPKRNGAQKREETPMTSAALWIDAIKTARQLLKATGSVPNAIAILKAVDG